MGTGGFADFDVDDFGVDGVAGLSSLREASVVLRGVQAEECRLAALKAAVIGKVRHDGLHVQDGFRSVNSWVRAELNCSALTASREVRRAKALNDLPATAETLASGRVGLDQVDLLAGLHTNTRVRADLIRIETTLLQCADRLPFPDFRSVVRRFEAHADPDGTERSFDNARDSRHANGSVVGTSFVFKAEGDTLSGVEIMSIFDAFVQHEFDTDWTAAKQIHGDTTRNSDLARTDRQRRYDAVLAMARAAAQAGTVTLPDVLVNLVIDEHTLDDTLNQLSGNQLSGNRMTGNPITPCAPDDILRRRSESINGTPIDPRHIVAAMVRGYIRRVVIDPTGLVINYGRKRRLFSGAARDAIMLMYQHCTEPGCLIAASHCQIDHLTPWTHNGFTDTNNGAPRCGHGNRAKHDLDHTVQRHPDGTIHTYRPDGTEIAPTQRQPPNERPPPP